MNKWVIILVVVTLAIGASSGVVFALTADGGGEHPGPVKDYVSLVDNLRAAGATVDPAGTESADFLAPESQWLTVNGEDIQAFAFGSAEEADAAAGGVSATGTTIVTTMADGTQKVSMVDWFAPLHFYKAGKLIVIYVGGDSDVIDALQEAMGPQFAGGEGPTQAPVVVPEPEVLPVEQDCGLAGGIVWVSSDGEFGCDMVQVLEDFGEFEEAAYQACGLAGGTFWVSSDGEFGCDMVQVLEDGGEGETQSQAPVVVPEPEVLPTD